MNSFTPIEQLPMPPKFMLDELEEEIIKYNTFLMSQILTIREARPIRLALREKFETHPVAKLLKDEAENHNCHSCWKGLEIYVCRFRQICAWRKVCSPDERTEKNTIVTLKVKRLPKSIRDNLKFKKGKNKGVYKHKFVELADNIVSKWYCITSDIKYKKSQERRIDKLLRIGFAKFFKANFELNKDLAKRDWYINDHHFCNQF
tara:strand:- start:287 stop:898 length:612 start_codon:yes stop_codon:yes gene_type:complete